MGKEAHSSRKRKPFLAQTGDAMPETVMYHVTHRAKVPAIERNGLNPMKARGRRKCVWVCSLVKLAWAAKHIADNHKWRAGDLVILRVCVRCEELKFSGRRGVYWINKTVKGYKL